MAVARSIFKENAVLRVINDGYENLIITDEEELIRFPRSEQVWLASRAERYVLHELSSHTDMPIAKIISISENPAYVRMTFLPGNQLSAEQLRKMPAEDLQKIGTQMAEFAYLLHTQIDVDDFMPYRTLHTWSYDDYLKRVLYDREDPSQKINELAKRYYEAWLGREHAKKYVIHDDLHTGNLLFNSCH